MNKELAKKLKEAIVDCEGERAGDIIEELVGAQVDPSQVVRDPVAFAQ